MMVSRYREIAQLRAELTLARQQRDSWQSSNARQCERADKAEKQRDAAVSGLRHAVTWLRDLGFEPLRQLDAIAAATK